MLTLKQILIRHGLSQRELGQSLGVSPSRVARWLNQGETPRTVEPGAVEAFLTAREVPAAERAQWATPLPEAEAEALWADARGARARAAAPSDGGRLAAPAVADVSEPEVDPMLIQRVGLSMQARQHFGLARDPFVSEIASSADVFLTPRAREAREQMRLVCQFGGFLALTGESGSGKTVLVEDLEDWAAREQPDVVLIRPYIVDMEEREGRRPSLTALDIGRRVIRVLDPRAPIRQDRQDRWAQIHDVLRQAKAAGKRVVLLIEEAHGLPHSTFRHLKRYLELKQGHESLVAIILVGQQELAARLNRMDESIREIVQRVEVLALEPLDGRVVDYLRHKFGRHGVALDAVLAPDAIDALTARLTMVPRGVRGAKPVSLIYPLAVGNVVAAAMNHAARIGQRVDGDAIREVA